MRIFIRFHGIFKDELEVKETVIKLSQEEVNLESVIEKIIEIYGNKAKIIEERLLTPDGPRIIILVNGKNAIYTGWLKTKLKNGDRVDIIPPLAGGVSINILFLISSVLN